MSNSDIKWKGKSGRQYDYWITPLGTSFKDEPGNYIYAKQASPGRWLAVYIGQTSSLRDRLANHEKEACAKRNGATHIHAHTAADDEKMRRAEETDLITMWQPTCNEITGSVGG